MVRSGRRRARRRLVVGGALLAIGVVAVVVAVLEQQGNDDNAREVKDRAGISYEVANDWQLGASQDPLVIFEREDSRTATMTHRPTDSDRSAAEQLADGADRSVCQDDPGPGPDIAGADEVAECRNGSPDRPKRAIGAVANGQFWVITVEQAASDTEGDDFVGSLKFTAPT